MALKSTFLKALGDEYITIVLMYAHSEYLYEAGGRGVFPNNPFS